jgi:hypothetical protein
MKSRKSLSLGLILLFLVVSVMLPAVTGAKPGDKPRGFLRVLLKNKPFS